MQYHANAKLTVRARREVIVRMQAGWSVTDIAQQMNVSRTTVYKWWERWRSEGDGGLTDRSSRPRRSPRRTSRRLERRIEQLRRSRKLGPARRAMSRRSSHSGFPSVTPKVDFGLPMFRAP